MRVQPLDYTFIILLAVMAIYGLYCFWKRFYRVNTKTNDDLVERYVILERYASRR